MTWVSVVALMTVIVCQVQSSEHAQAQSRSKAETSAPASEAKPTAAAKSKAKTESKAIAPTSPATPADAAVRVRSQAEMRKPRSPFLMAPGEASADRDSSGRYGEETGITDWNDIPPWRQASFFGIRARGQLFVYVVDCSGSMIDADRLARATMELRRSVFALQPPQRFEVIFYNQESMPMPGGPKPRPADPQAKNQLLYWLRLIEPDGGTDPRPALKQAVALRPDAVFLLSDGLFPEGTVEMVTKLNTRKIPIHCIDLAGGLAGDDLKRIARANGGRYASRPGDLQGSR